MEIVHVYEAFSSDSGLSRDMPSGWGSILTDDLQAEIEMIDNEKNKQK